MTRLTITIDPMPVLRTAATETVNDRFNAEAQTSIHRDQAHAEKRAIATTVSAGGSPSPEFTAEATLRAVTPTALAALVLSKPNLAAQRELARQQIMVRIDAATTPAEIADILAAR